MPSKVVKKDGKPAIAPDIAIRSDEVKPQPSAKLVVRKNSILDSIKSSIKVDSEGEQGKMEKLVIEKDPSEPEPEDDDLEEL